jgi:hypothetical protein
VQRVFCELVVFQQRMECVDSFPLLSGSCGLSLASNSWFTKYPKCIKLHRPRILYMRKSDIMMADRIGGMLDGITT